MIIPPGGTCRGARTGGLRAHPWSETRQPQGTFAAARITAGRDHGALARRRSGRPARARPIPQTLPPALRFSHNRLTLNVDPKERVVEACFASIFEASLRPSPAPGRGRKGKMSRSHNKQRRFSALTLVVHQPGFADNDHGLYSTDGRFPPGAGGGVREPPAPDDDNKSGFRTGAGSLSRTPAPGRRHPAPTNQQEAGQRT